MNIGEAAAAAGVTPKMIRHCEQIGLLPPSGRTASGYRQFGDAEIQILRFVRRARGLGFTSAQIAELLSLRSHRGRHSSRVRALAQQHLDELDRKLREIHGMRAALQQLMAACANNDQPQCGILDGLSAPG